MFRSRGGTSSASPPRQRRTRLRQRGEDTPGSGGGTGRSAGGSYDEEDHHHHHHHRSCLSFHHFQKKQPYPVSTSSSSPDNGNQFYGGSITHNTHKQGNLSSNGNNNNNEPADASSLWEPWVVDQDEDDADEPGHISMITPSKAGGSFSNTGNRGSTTTSSVSGSPNDRMSQLLTPPKPMDRGSTGKRRMQVERAKRRQMMLEQQQQQQQQQQQPIGGAKRTIGLYEGEMEPEGVRGQEATVNESNSTAVNTGRTAVPYHTLSRSQPQTQSQSSSPMITPKLRRFHAQQSEPSQDNHHLKTSSNISVPSQPELVQQQQPGAGPSTPPLLLATVAADSAVATPPPPPPLPHTSKVGGGAFHILNSHPNSHKQQHLVANPATVSPAATSTTAASSTTTPTSITTPTPAPTTQQQQQQQRQPQHHHPYYRSSLLIANKDGGRAASANNRGAGIIEEEMSSTSSTSTSSSCSLERMKRDLLDLEGRYTTKQERLQYIQYLHQQRSISGGREGGDGRRSTSATTTTKRRQQQQQQQQQRSGEEPAKWRQQQHERQVTTGPPSTPTATAVPVTPESDEEEDNHDEQPFDDSNNLRSNNNHRRRNNNYNGYETSSSTRSDQDFQYMLPDLMPSRSPTLPEAEAEAEAAVQVVVEPAAPRNENQSERQQRTSATAPSTTTRTGGGGSQERGREQFSMGRDRGISNNNSSNVKNQNNIPIQDEPSPAAALAAAKAAAAVASGFPPPSSSLTRPVVPIAAAEAPPPSSKRTTSATTGAGPLLSPLPPHISAQLPENVHVLHTLAMEHIHNGEYDNALMAFTKVLEIQLERYGGGDSADRNNSDAATTSTASSAHPTVASAYHNLGTVHAKRASVLMEGSYQQRHVRGQALQCFQAAARTARDALGRNHPNVAVSLVRIGFLLLQSRQYQNAIVTFKEALRIRLICYGGRHGLVANLYNNLGVCHMHLSHFEKGYEYLQAALDIQRDYCSSSSNNKTAANNMVKGNDTWMHKLELADTLFNIGGLCLEWMRKQGPDARHAINAEEAFAEALEIRAQVLGPDDPMVMQVKALLDMARAVPRPRISTTPSRRRMVHATSSSSPPRSRGLKNTDPRVYSSSSADAVATTRQQQHPRRTTTTSPAQSSTRNAMTRSFVDATAGSSPSPIRPVRHSHRACTGSQPFDERGSYVSVRASTASQPYDERNHLQQQEQQHSIFRSPSRKATGAAAVSPRAAATTATNMSPPRSKRHLPGVTFSFDEDDSVAATSPTRNHGTRVYVSAHNVPASPSGASNSNWENTDTSALSQEVLAPISRSLESSFTPDISSRDIAVVLDTSPRVSKAYSYDAEENCLISETGVMTENGSKIHYPLSWNRAGLMATATAERGCAGSPSRDILVTRPFRTNTPPSAATNNDQSSSAHTNRVTNNNNRNAPLATAYSNSSNSDKWGSETVNFDTGNKERDDVMTRARAILHAHDLQEVIDHQEQEEQRFLGEQSGDDDDRQHVYDTGGDHEDGVVPPRSSNTKRTSMEQELALEDGVAPLGGHWPTSQTYVSQHDMLRDPMNNLHQIHDLATQKLKNNDNSDALALFDTVLRCQCRKQGYLHPDVASALHNVGIAQLRAQNYEEALKAFEEAARIRKGSLGNQHPHVAVSLVKVGITLLLLHRFEDALWCFREALSVRKHALGALHPSTARIYNNLGCVHVEFNEFREARRAFEAALDVQRNALAHDSGSGPLLFGTATTLCNLGYLYRYRDMHAKATLVLKEALDLQERVLGREHATVLSTLDNLADSCANSGHAAEALKYYNMVLERFARVLGSSPSKKGMRAEAVLLYKMSRVHRQCNDREAQLARLKLALQLLRASSDIEGNHVSSNRSRISASADTLERRIQYDIRSCREQLEKDELKWV